MSERVNEKKKERKQERKYFPFLWHESICVYLVSQIVWQIKIDSPWRNIYIVRMQAGDGN